MTIVKGINLSDEEYQAFTQYLTERGVQSFTKDDVSRWLKHYHGNPGQADDLPMIILQAYNHYKNMVRDGNSSAAKELWKHYERWFTEHNLKKLHNGDPGNPEIPVRKIKPVSITLTRAEGPHEEVGKPQTVTGERHSIWIEADSVLRGWAGTAPSSGGYDKIDFVVTYEDGQTYQGRYDLKHWSVESPNLGKHVSSFIKYYSGLYKPPHMSTEQYQHYLSTVAPQTIEDTKRFYERYDVGD